jgi:hypothetical protein
LRCWTIEIHEYAMKERCLSPHTINTLPLTKQGALKLKDACGYLGGISPSSLRRLIERGL